MTRQAGASARDLECAKHGVTEPEVCLVAVGGFSYAHGMAQAAPSHSKPMHDDILPDMDIVG